MRASSPRVYSRHSDVRSVSERRTTAQRLGPPPPTRTRTERAAQCGTTLLAALIAVVLPKAPVSAPESTERSRSSFLQARELTEEIGEVGVLPTSGRDASIAALIARGGRPSRRRRRIGAARLNCGGRDEQAARARSGYRSGCRANRRRLSRVSGERWLVAAPAALRRMRTHRLSMPLRTSTRPSTFI